MRHDLHGGEVDSEAWIWDRECGRGDGRMGPLRRAAMMPGIVQKDRAFAGLLRPIFEQCQSDDDPDGNGGSWGIEEGRFNQPLAAADSGQGRQPGVLQISLSFSRGGPLTVRPGLKSSERWKPFARNPRPCASTENAQNGAGWGWGRELRSL